MIGFLGKLFSRRPKARGFAVTMGKARRRAPITATLGDIRAEYDAARTTDHNSRHWAVTDSLSADAANDVGTRQVLRDRARYEVANNSYARGITLTLANDCIGTGPRLQVLTSNSRNNTRIEAEWLRWSERIGLARKLHTMRLAKAVDGEAFGLLINNPAIMDGVQLDIAPLEADQVTDPLPVGIDSQSIDGIRFDSAGNVREYHVLRQHPGGPYYGGLDFDTIQAESMLHLFRGDRPGQHRGVPEVTPALPLFAQLRRFTLATISAAETAADFAGVMYTDGPAITDPDDVDALDAVDLERNAMLTLPRGWKMGQMRAEHPSTTYTMFKSEIIQEIARCLNMPYNVAAGDSSKYNYASGRMDHQVYFKSIAVERAEWERLALDRLLSAWFDEAALLGLLPGNMGAMRDLPHRWHWDGREHVDPAKEANAEATRLSSGTTSYPAIFAAQGKDWEQEQAAQAMALGLTLDEYRAALAGKLFGTAPQPEMDDEPEEQAATPANKRRTIRAAHDQKSLQFAACDLVLVAAEGDGGDTPPTFEMVAYNGGKIKPSYWGSGVVIDLAGMTASDTTAVYLSHNPSQIVGHTTSVAKTAKQLSAKGIVSGVGEAAQQVTGSSKNGFPWQASVGADVLKLEEVEEGSSAKANGQTWAGPVIIARETVLGEISFVPRGADTTTSATVAASAADHISEAEMNFQQWIEAQGFVFADLSDQQRTTLQAAYDAENATTTTTTSDPPEITADDLRNELRAEAAAERTRVSAINRIGNEYPDVTIDAEGETVDLAAHAIGEGWTPEQTELHALRASRASAPAVHSRSHEGDCSLEAMQAAQLIAADVPLDSPIFGTQQAVAMGLPQWTRRGLNDDTRQRYMEAAHRYSDMSAVDRCREFIRLDGRTVPASRRETIQAAFSGASLDSVFTQSVSAALLMGYTQSVDTTDGWTQATDVPDFKANQRELLSTMGGLKKLPRGTEAEHADRSDSEETYKVKRYAKQFQIDEQDIIDDRLDVFSTTPQQMGAAAARIRPDLVYYIILANANLVDAVALFASGHSNLNTSATLAAATLKAAIADIEKQQQDSVNLNLRATHLIVPSDLKHTALNLTRSATLLYGADDETQIGSENTLSSGENLSVVSDARLANGVTDPDSGTAGSGSATTWYMASNMAHTIEVGYLRGTGRAPQVRSTVLDKGMWGINWDVKMDIGAKALDFRGLHKNTA